jgi:hypothetical protein
MCPNLIKVNFISFSVLAMVAPGVVAPGVTTIRAPGATTIGAPVLVAMALCAPVLGVLLQIAHPDPEDSIFMPVTMLTANSTNDLAIL